MLITCQEVEIHYDNIALWGTVMSFHLTQKSTLHFCVSNVSTGAIFKLSTQYSMVISIFFFIFILFSLVIVYHYYIVS